MDAIDNEYLRYLVDLLEQVSRGDPAQQADLTKSLMEFGQIPRAEYYLASVLLDANSLRCGEMIRGMAGLILKNEVRKRRSCEGLVKFLLERGLLMALSSPDGMVRATAGSLIAGLFEAGGGRIPEWPSALNELCGMAEGEGIGGLSAMETIEKVCEDCGEAMVYEDPEGLVFLVDCLLRVIGSKKDIALRKRAIHSLNYLIGYGPDAVLERLNDLINVLSMNGSEKRLQAPICQSLNHIFGCWPLELLDQLPSLMSYTFQLMSECDDEAVALEACEFWLALVEFRSEGVFEIEAVLEDGFLANDLIAVLMRNARYSDDDPEVINCDQEDDDEVMPRHHTTRNHDHGVEEGEVENDEAGNDSEEDYQWNLRKCSAATLDSLSHALPPSKLLPALLPQLQAYLASVDDWKRLEVGILVLGAISEGCGEVIESHLPGLWEGLCLMMKHPKPLIKSIAAWTCGRYARWAEEQGQSGSIQAAIQGLADANAKVQLACCSALQVYSQKARGLLKALVSPLMESLNWALKAYSRKRCLVACFELIRSLGDGCFEMTPGIKSGLMDHWRRVLSAGSVEDPTMLPLLEAIASIPMSEYFDELIYGSLELANRQLAKGEEEVEFDVVIVAMDLVGSLILSGVSGEVQFEEDIGRLVIGALSMGPTELHQSAYGLLGDLASVGLLCQVYPEANREMAMALLQYAFLAEVIPEGSVSLSTANNAIWSFGVIAMTDPWAIQKISSKIVGIACGILRESPPTSRTRGYYCNLVVAIGRALRDAEDVESMGRMVPWREWSGVMREVEEVEERVTALEPVLHLAVTFPHLFCQADLEAISTIPR